MVTDQQVRYLMKELQKGKSLTSAAAKAGMDVKTARKYRRQGKLPSQRPSWNRRPGPHLFSEFWPDIEGWLERDPGLQAKTIFEELCRRHPGRFEDGQLRTLQRQIRRWRIRHGTPKEVYFPQTHPAGYQAQSDFTCMNELGVLIDGEPFRHLFFHFMLTYSNWETGMICFSESFESLVEGMQAALWELGVVPVEHRTDSLSAAVTLIGNRDEFTRGYQEVLDHYGLAASHSTPGRGHENGDVEQSHHRFKQAVDQALRLRGRRDFISLEAYNGFLRDVLNRRNAPRANRLAEEVSVMRPLPVRRVDDFTTLAPRVSRFSVISVKGRTYSVDSSLIGQLVQVRLFSQHLEVWFDGRLCERIERLRGKRQHRINYRHVIHSLSCKPGAFARYRWREDLFPRTVFRIAYDWLRQHAPATADRTYVSVLLAAATVSEQRVAEILRGLIEAGQSITTEELRRQLEVKPDQTAGAEVVIGPIDLRRYDQLLDHAPEVAA